jgi:hypothetical protein
MRIAASDEVEVTLVCDLMCSERTDETLLMMIGDGFDADPGKRSWHASTSGDYIGWDIDVVDLKT